MEKIVTGDEAWIYHFQPILRLKIRVGFHPRATDLSLRAVAKHQMACCMRYSLIRKVQSYKFQSRKVVLSLESFIEKVFLLNLLISIRNADPTPVSVASNYSHDKSQAHKSATVQEYLKESGLDVLDHPPYSLNCLPVTWLFPRLKKMLAGYRFESPCGIGSGVYQCLQHIPKEDYRAAFQK